MLKKHPNSFQGCYLTPHTSPQASIFISGKLRNAAEKVEVDLAAQSQQVGDEDSRAHHGVHLPYVH